MDIKSAYPSVSHELLLHTLSGYGFDTGTIKWMKSFKNKTQCVYINNNKSNETQIKCGLIQGDNLSQTLFSLIINEITNAIQHCKAHLYADDLGIYIEADPNNINDAIERINNDIIEIHNFIEKRGMQLNREKTQPIMIGSKHNLEQISTNEQKINKIRVNDMDLDFLDTVKYLGFNFNREFTSETRVNSIIKNVNFTLAKIRHCRNSDIILT